MRWSRGPRAQREQAQEVEGPSCPPPLADSRRAPAGGPCQSHHAPTAGLPCGGPGRRRVRRRVNRWGRGTRTSSVRAPHGSPVRVSWCAMAVAARRPGRTIDDDARGAGTTLGMMWTLTIRDGTAPTATGAGRRTRPTRRPGRGSCSTSGRPPASSAVPGSAWGAGPCCTAARSRRTPAPHHSQARGGPPRGPSVGRVARRRYSEASPHRADGDPVPRMPKGVSWRRCRSSWWPSSA